MAIAATQHAAQYLGGDADAYATTVEAPTGDTLQVLFAHSSRSVSDPSTPTVSGGAMTTWDLITSVLYRTGTAVNYRCSAFRALQAVPGAPAAATIQFPVGEIQTQCAYGWTEFSDVDTSGANGAGAVAQIVPGSGSSTTPTVAMAALGAAGNVVYMGAAHRANQNYAPPTYTELFDVTGSTPIGGVTGIWMPALVTDLNPATVGVGSDVWGAIGLEIVQASVPPVVGGTLSSRRRPRYRVVHQQEQG